MIFSKRGLTAFVTLTVLAQCYAQIALEDQHFFKASLLNPKSTAQVELEVFKKEIKHF